MELFYVRPENVSEDELVLDDFERKHLVQTLRKKIDDPITVTDGAGRIFSGIIIRTHPKLIVKIQRDERKPRPATRLILACGFIKQNRMDFILEKGTELGVDAFWFFRSRFANYYTTNTARWQKVLRQALKQSLRVYLPQIQVFAGLDDFFAQAARIESRLIAIDAKQPLLATVLANEKTARQPSVLLSVGPEGGFDEAEIKQFLENDFRGFSLGAHRLRTETAALASAAIVSQYIH